ncbi:N/A [soil metagenome]
MKMKPVAVAHRESGPNMTPLVDVVMVILIFLMLAGSFGKAEHYLASATPTVTGCPGEQPGNLLRVDEPVEIYVSTVNGHFVARGGTIDAADSATLCRQLKSLRTRMNDAGTKTSDIRVRIAPGRDVRFEHVVAVQEAAMQESFEKIGFVSAK